MTTLTLKPAAAARIDALLEEDALPTTAFSVSDGAIHPGIEIQLHNARSFSVPSLFIGGYYIMLDRHDPCLYRCLGDVGIVRRVSLKKVMLENGKTKRYLEKAREEGAQLLLHASLAQSQPQEQVKFFTGAWGTATCEVEDGGEVLLSFLDADAAALFYADGRVRLVASDGDKLRLTNLTPLQQAQTRISRVKHILRHEVSHISDDENRFKKTDKMLYELVAVLSSSNEEIRTAALRALSNAVAEKHLRFGSGVHRAAEEILDRLGDDESRWTLKETFKGSTQPQKVLRENRNHLPRFIVEARRQENRTKRLMAQGKPVGSSKSGGHKKDKNNGKH